MNPEKRSILPGLAFKGFTSKYRRPQLHEGFQDITEVAFQVSSQHAATIHSGLGSHDSRMQFVGSDVEREIWTRHWT